MRITEIGNENRLSSSQCNEFEHQICACAGLLSRHHKVDEVAILHFRSTEFSATGSVPRYVYCSPYRVAPAGGRQTIVSKLVCIAHVCVDLRNAKHSCWPRYPGLGKYLPKLIAALPCPTRHDGGGDVRDGAWRQSRSLLPQPSPSLPP